MARITRQVVTSIGGFVIIALIAAAIIIGGVLFVKHRADVARHDQAVKVADDQSQTQNQQGSQTQSQPTTTDSSNDQSHSTTTTPTDTGAGSSRTNALPVTGPEDSVIQVVAVGALAFATSLYIASRRARSTTF